MYSHTLRLHFLLLDTTSPATYRGLLHTFPSRASHYNKHCYLYTAHCLANERVLLFFLLLPATCYHAMPANASRTAS